MATSMEKVVTDFLKPYPHKGCTVSFTYNKDYIRADRTVIAQKIGNIILVNTLLEAKNIIELTYKLYDYAEKYNLTMVQVPMHYGEENFPQLEVVRRRLRTRLQYWSTNILELTDNTLKDEYIQLYNEFKIFLKECYNARVPYTIQKTYKKIYEPDFVQNATYRIKCRSIVK